MPVHLSAMEENEWKELAGHLRQPAGEKGIEVAKQMEQTNAFMITATVDTLGLKDNEHVLEVGFGNGSHVAYVLGRSASVLYTGADISEWMQQEAIKINNDFVTGKQASFIVTDGKVLPFEDNSFDAFFTVNTIYFWQDPLGYAKEILRVLKKGGRGCITFAQKSFMQQLPFVKHGFTLYSKEDTEALLLEAGTAGIRSDMKTEKVQSNTGDRVEREFVITEFRKP